MPKARTLIATLVGLCMIASCGQFGQSGEQSSANVVELRAVGFQFEGPNAARSGWTTIRLVNPSDMEHFAVLQRLPDGVTIEDQVREVTPRFQAGLERLLAGDEAAAAAEFGALPQWFSDVVFIGGPGLVAGGRQAEATVYLTPGRYTLECYVKTGGVFHSFDPRPGVRAMLHELMVSDDPSAAAEPAANATIAISNEGYSIVDGAFRAGSNTVRANFVDQTLYPNFVGHDAHIVRLEQSADLDAVSAWMDWRSTRGLETPAPAVFVGGINEMPAGEHGYFTVDLEPGEYAIVAEVDDPISRGLVLPFTIE